MKDCFIQREEIFTFIDPIFNITPAVAGLDRLGLDQPGVGDDETDPREEFADSPLDLADRPARFVPALGLETEINF